jgi:hypothetical protein
VAVQAASLSIVGGYAGALNANFDLTAETGVSGGDAVTIFDSGNIGGLQINFAPTDIKLEFLGSGASWTNKFVDLNLGGGDVFNNKVNVVGDTATFTQLAAGFLDVMFTTNAGTPNIADDGSALNGGAIDAGLTMAIYDYADGSYLMLFGDGAGDADWDDLAVRVSVVPLPPAMLLFGGALMGMGWLARRRKQALSA